MQDHVNSGVGRPADHSEGIQISNKENHAKGRGKEQMYTFFLRSALQSTVFRSLYIHTAPCTKWSSCQHLLLWAYATANVY